MQQPEINEYGQTTLNKYECWIYGTGYLDGKRHIWAKTASEAARCVWQFLGLAGDFQLLHDQQDNPDMTKRDNALVAFNRINSAGVRVRRA